MDIKVLEPTYQDFLKTKVIQDVPTGLKIIPKLNPMLFDFQKDIVKWSLKKGRSCIFADCGLGKTPMQLEWAKHIPGNVLILAPLAVSSQTLRESEKFGISDISYSGDGSIKNKITITNYERIEKFNLSDFNGIVLDESSILKSYTGKYRTMIIEQSRNIPYRLACTATPAPNDFMELGNHAEFVGSATGYEMLSMFFINDMKNPSGEKWRLKGHAEKEFWKWVCSWAVMIRKPSDLGYDDGNFILPELNIIQKTIHSKTATEGFLFAMEARGLQERQKARKTTINERVSKCAELVNNSDEKWLIWCNLNDESSMLKKAIPGAIEVKGSDKDEHKKKSAIDFANGKIKVLISKPKIFGYGMNYQVCHNMAFVGLSDSYEQYYQAVRRCWRFGQKKEVMCYIITADTEGAVVKNIQRKEKDAVKMAEEMVENMHAINEENIKGTEKTKGIFKTDYAEGDGWKFYLNDSCQVLKKIESESIGYSIFSPPFSSLYTYTNLEQDISNCKGDDEFYEHFMFIIKELFRITMSGRNLSFHVMNTTLQKARDGVLGIKDLRGIIIKLFQSVGFVFHSEVCIWKDPGIAMQRTKHMGLLHKYVDKDSAVSRQGLADYLVTMSKPGINQKPIEGYLDHYVGDNNLKQYDNDKSQSIEIWNKYASPVWMDINPSDTLQYRSARAEKDEKHMTPTQLQVIHRALQLWSLPGDVVLSPFAGIGSEGYESIKLGRKFIGIELKESYWNQGVKNLQMAIDETKKGRLF